MTRTVPNCYCAPCYEAKHANESPDPSRCHNRPELRPQRMERALVGLMYYLESRFRDEGHRHFWSFVGEACGLGSTSAAQLCLDMGRDFDTGEELGDG